LNSEFVYYAIKYYSSKKSEIAVVVLVYRSRAVPEPPSILVDLCHVDNNVITVAWQRCGHVVTGNDVSYVLELDDGDAGPFRVSIFVTAK